MKKIMILGGAPAQVPLIQAAKSLGYYIVLCDWTTTNPGIPLAHKHHQISTLDRDAVLKVAREEKIDGVISNSEPAMLNVSFIAEQMGLRGNSVSTVEVLLSKDKFREVQEKAGVFAPKHFVTGDLSEFLAIAELTPLPFVVKPVESSGSRGTIKIEQYDRDMLIQAFRENIGFSRNDQCSIEEYVEMPGLTIVEGDVFVLDKDILWDGLFFDTRSSKRPMIPMSDSLPLRVGVNQRRIIEHTLQHIFNTANVVFGELNIEMYFTQSGELFVIEINPRQGGCGVPGFIQRHCGIDMYRLLVSTAVRDDTYYQFLKTYRRECNYVTRFAVFAHKSGIYQGLAFKPEIEPYVTNIDDCVLRGSEIEDCHNANSVLAYVDLKFDSYKTQHLYFERLEEFITPIV